MRQDIDYVVMRDALLYVANETQRNPMDSVRDICNEAFELHGVDLKAEWSGSNDAPISFKSNLLMVTKLQRQKDGRKAFLAIDGPKRGEFIFSYCQVMEYTDDDLDSAKRYWCPILRDEVLEFPRHQYICDFETGDAKYNSPVLASEK